MKPDRGLIYAEKRVQVCAVAVAAGGRFPFVLVRRWRHSVAS